MTRIVRRPLVAPPAALEAAGVHPVLARVYAARGVASAAELDTAWSALPPPASMKGIDAAARRLVAAIDSHEPIVVVADYDADGATACALALRGLAAMGADIGFVVPNRFVYGYGLTPAIVELAAARAPGLIVTVDNGIASIEGVEAAAARGIDVLVTDHHLPGPVLPRAAVIVDPNQPGCGFPSRNLAGVGVMYYVLMATRALLRARGTPSSIGRLPNLAALADLVALGTVADVVPLDAVNRVLVAQGLSRIRAGRAQPGIRALLEVAGRDPAHATAADLGYAVGPRLNAAGRLDDMSVGIRCLASDDEGEARELAATLGKLNDARRGIEAGMGEAAARAIDAIDPARFAASASICLADASWHQGVVGIVASRIKDRHLRPAVVFAPGDPGEWRGSARSVEGFHVRDALDRVATAQPGLVRRFGGHAMAAGVTIGVDDLEAFARAFEGIARDALGDGPRDRSLATDGALEAGELTAALAEAIEGAVWGQGFAAPAFEGAFELLAQRIVGERHSALTLKAPGLRLRAMLFNRAEPLPPRLRAVYRPVLNRFRGEAALELVVEHWEPLDAGAASA